MTSRRDLTPRLSNDLSNKEAVIRCAALEAAIQNLTLEKQILSQETDRLRFELTVKDREYDQKNCEIEQTASNHKHQYLRKENEINKIRNQNAETKNILISTIEEFGVIFKKIETSVFGTLFELM